jgi:hypothetical protein
MLHLKLVGQELKSKPNRSEIEDDELAHKIAKVLRNKPHIHKVLVIDEIDTFSH